MSEVIIIGGGPAGSALGCYLGMAGIGCTLFDSDVHPRPHVGESLVTSTTRIFKEIGFLKTMEAAGFPKKYGASWHTSVKNQEFAIRFSEFPQTGVDQDYTYHVDRGKFDLLLLKHAESLGCKVHQGVPVREVVFKDGFTQGVDVGVAGQTQFVACDLVVDASGRNTFLGGKLGLKKRDPIFDQYAIHSWFEDLDRGQEPNQDFIQIYFLPQQSVRRGWVWQIPITDKITSVGVVAEKEAFKNSKTDPKKWFYDHVQSNPDLTRAMRNAKPIREFKSEGDYSYSMEKFVGNGYILIGDAARFVDPIFSSGISVALTSAKYASEQIKHASEKRDFSEEALAPYENKMRSGVSVWYEFIRLYYKMLPLFTHFIEKKETRIEVLRLLQGEVYDRGEVKVLTQMRNYIREIENTPGHVFKGHLTDIPID